MAVLQSKNAFTCVRTVDGDIAWPTEKRRDELAANAAAAGGAGNFLLPDAAPWAEGQMWIGDAAGAALGYGAELVSIEEMDDDPFAERVWFVGPYEKDLIGFELFRLDVGPGLSVWVVGDLIMPQPDDVCG